MCHALSGSHPSGGEQRPNGTPITKTVNGRQVQQLCHRERN
jgi:hypothetical protein